MNVLRKIGEGARDMIKRYGEIEKCQRVGREFRQTNIRGFYGINGRGVDRPLEITRRNSADKKKNKENRSTKNETDRGKCEVYVKDGIMYWEFKKG
jgi:hypothetical protein